MPFFGLLSCFCSPKPPCPRPTARLQLEMLEDRLLPSISVIGESVFVKTDAPSEKNGNLTIILDHIVPFGDLRVRITDNNYGLTGVPLEKATFAAGTIHAVNLDDNVDNALGHNFFNVELLSPDIFLVVNATKDADAVNICHDDHLLDYIRGNMWLNGTGTDYFGKPNVSLNIFGETDATADRYDIYGNDFERNGALATPIFDSFSAVYYGFSAVNVFGGHGKESYFVHDTAASAVTSIFGGVTQTAVSVLGTTGELDVAGAHVDTVNVGRDLDYGAFDAGSLKRINGTVKVDTGGGTNLLVDDNSNMSPRTAVLTTQVSAQITWGLIHGLSQGDVIYNPAAVSRVKLETGSGASEIGGVVNIKVLATEAVTDLEVAGKTYINVGSNGSMQGIHKDLNVNSTVAGAVGLTLDDSTDTNARNVTITQHQVSGLAADAAINIGQQQVGSGVDVVDPLSDLTVLGSVGDGGNVSVKSTQVGANTTIVSNAPDRVHIGDNGSLLGIKGILSLAGTVPGGTQVTIDGSTDESATATLSQFAAADGTATALLTGLAPADILWSDAAMASVDIRANSQSTLDAQDTGGVLTGFNGVQV